MSQQYKLNSVGAKTADEKTGMRKYRRAKTEVGKTEKSRKKRTTIKNSQDVGNS